MSLTRPDLLQCPLQLKHGTEGVDVGSEAEVRWASHLLQTPAEGILRSLTTKATEARGERLLTPLNIDQALDARDAIAKVAKKRAQISSIRVEPFTCINIVVRLCMGCEVRAARIFHSLFVHDVF